jgi:hypothetical protein
MASDYDAIREQNLKEYGEGERHLAFLGRLYSDRTHFIYELLQNAEDVGATNINFILHSDRLEVFHNGSPFIERNVKGICGVGEGDKNEDLTKIGTFGVGFKSVFAYTLEPEIFSIDESFKISNYVRPYGIPTITIPKEWTTKFIFSFKTADNITPEIAYNEIENRLRTLSVRTLLFLKKIEKIDWEVFDIDSGFYHRKSTQQEDHRRKVKVIGSTDNKEEVENWLIFEREVDIPNTGNHTSVEVAYSLVREKNTDNEVISKITESPLVVFFPTEKETRLGFLIQGAYRTTPARDNIPKDDEWNKKLIQETCQLIGDSLVNLRESGELDLNVINSLPIRSEDFLVDNMFKPIFDTVKALLYHNNLIPAYTGSFVSGKNAKLGRGPEIKYLLEPALLNDLFKSDSDLNWVDENITQERTPDLRRYLLFQLRIDEITAEFFVRKITEEFLGKQTDAWMILFYKYLLNREALWKKKRYSFQTEGVIRSKKFIRIENGTHIHPFKKDGEPSVYFPKSGMKNSFRTIKSSLVVDPDVCEFFKRLGIHEPDIVSEVIEKVLPVYQSSEINVSDSDHKKHIDLIVSALNTDSVERKNALITNLRNTHFILGCNAKTSKLAYAKPKELYIRTSNLECYFENNENAWFLHDLYGEKISIAFERLGVTRSVRISKTLPDSEGHVKIYDIRGNHSRGLHGFDPNCDADGLEYALMNPSLKKSVFIWSELVLPNVVNIRGMRESSPRKTYEGSRKRQEFSTFGNNLNESEWLPNKIGEFKKPGEIALHDLPDEFERDDQVSSQLKMKSSVVTKLATSIGVDPVDIELLKQLKSNPDEYERVKQFLTRSFQKPVFPTRKSVNPSRRKEKKSKANKDAVEKSYETKKRSVRVSSSAVDPQTWLTENYTNDDEQLICQMCEDEMPFKKRDGEYYFEAVELFNDEKLEHEELYVALCPVCAAKYKEFVKQDKDQICEIKKEIINGKNEMPLKIGEEKSALRFVETHVLDLGVILNL